MYLKSIYISNFKNHDNFEKDFSEKINCVVGDNGVGKSNLLDAISYLCNCKSFIQAIDNFNIKRGEDFFAVTGHFIDENEVDKVNISLKKNEKKIIKLNDKAYDKILSHYGKFPLVIISPYDSDLINENSDVRRKFLDSIISLFNKNYLDNLLRYNAALAQRNKILKDFDIDATLLDIFNKKLVNHGQEIFDTRRDFVEKFSPLCRDFYKIISEEKEEISIVYHSQLFDKEFSSGLQEAYEADKFLKYSSFGIHKDDLKLNINILPIKKIGSQGQQKSLTIALRLAQFEMIRQIRNISPILILDDIFDKLDENRVKKLLEIVCGDNFGQIFLSDTNQKRLQKVIPKTIKHCFVVL